MVRSGSIDLLGQQYGYPTITGVRLRREQHHFKDDPLVYAVVAVEIDGEWRDVIMELIENNFDHFWNPASINTPRDGEPG